MNSTPLGHQLELFERRLPKKPYCSDDLQRGLLVRGRRWAVRKRYIQANPPWLRAWLIFDVDRNGAVLAWDDAHLPEPYWTAQNPANGHAHLAWALDAPVLVSEAARQAPLRYLTAIEASMRERMDADPSYSGLITKNPLHPDWRVCTGGAALTLAEMAEWLPALGRRRERRAPEAVGLGRNVDTFEHVRRWAYRAVRRYWAPRPQYAFVEWRADTIRACREYTGQEHRPALDERETYHIGKSIAAWTWWRFTPQALDHYRGRAKRGAGIKSAQARRGRTADRDAAILAAHAAGDTQRAIAAAFGLALSTVPNILRRGGDSKSA